MTDNITQILELLEEPTAKDLAAIDQRLADLDKQQAGLKALRRLLALRLGKTPAPVNGAPNQRCNVLENRLKIAETLKEHGPMRRADIGRYTEVPNGGSLTNALECSWFAKHATKGFELTGEGRQALEQRNGH
jgi:hypothetical protein